MLFDEFKIQAWNLLLLQIQDLMKFFDRLFIEFKYLTIIYLPGVNTVPSLATLRNMFIFMTQNKQAIYFN